MRLCFHVTILQNFNHTDKKNLVYLSWPCSNCVQKQVSQLENGSILLLCLMAAVPNFEERKCSLYCTSAKIFVFLCNLEGLFGFNYTKDEKPCYSPLQKCWLYKLLKEGNTYWMTIFCSNNGVGVLLYCLQFQHERWCCLPPALLLLRSPDTYRALDELQ